MNSQYHEESRRHTLSGRFLFWSQLVVILSSAFLPLRLDAQALHGSIVGTVTDSSDARVLGAKVTVSQKETSWSRTTTTNFAGEYSFLSISPGTYDVTVSHEGFQSFTVRGVLLVVNTVARADARLRVGAVAEAVQVSAQAPSLQTDRAETRADITSKSLTNLPLPANRNFQALLIAVPGFSPPTNMHTLSSNPVRSYALAANGGSISGTTVSVDGAASRNVPNPHVAAYLPSVEAIEVVTVATGSFNGESGHASTSAINVQMKSGTNSFHGVMYEYLTNNRLKARPFFLVPGAAIPKLIQHISGGTLGGPIKRDKLFFFAAYDRFTDSRTANALLTVPTAAIRSGDMSGSTRPVYDPTTGSADGSGRTPFPNNTLPTASISPIVRKIIPLIPLPNYGGSALVTNYYASGPFNFTRHTLDTKTDWYATQKLKLAARISVIDSGYFNPPAFGELVGPRLNGTAYVGHGTSDVYSNTFSAVYTVSPSFIIDGYFAYTNQVQKVTYPNLPEGREKVGTDFLGIPGTNGPLPIQRGWPTLNVTNYASYGGSEFDDVSYPQKQYVANATWVKGSHTVRFGLDMLHQSEKGQAYGNKAGTFNFAGGPTTVRGGVASNQFNTFATFLLGLPTGGNISTPIANPYGFIREAQSFFLTDQWRVSRKVTVNIGFRYEYQPPGKQLNGTGIARYDPTTDKVLVCGVGPTPLDCGTNFHRKRGFAPRVGIAWRATDTLVVRTGYSIAFEPWPNSRGLGGYPSAVTAALVQLNAFQPANATGTAWDLSPALAKGLPPFPPAPDLSSGVVNLPLSQGLAGWGKDFYNGYTQSWNFTLQKQLSHGFVAQAGYVASRTITPYFFDLNGGMVLGAGIAGRPLFQQYGRTAGMSVFGPRLTNAHYDSLQTSLEHRFASGYQMNVAYTWSKTLGIAPTNSGFILPGTGIPINTPGYMDLNRALLPSDIPHLLAITGIGDLPFGKGKRWANRGGLATALLGGWHVNGIFTSYSGTPFSVTSDSTSLNDAGNSTQRADQVKPNVQILGRVGPGTSYFDPLAYAPVTTARFGNAGFYSLRGPGMINVDASLFRDFRLTERFTMQLRAEAFNFANTPHFSNPSNTTVSDMVLNTDGTIRDLGGFSSITGVKATGRDGFDERQFRLGLRISF